MEITPGEHMYLAKARAQQAVSFLDQMAAKFMAFGSIRQDEITSALQQLEKAVEHLKICVKS